MRANSTAALFVTDRTLPMVTASTQLPREMYDAFGLRAIKAGTNKGALLRKLVEGFLASAERVEKGDMR